MRLVLLLLALVAGLSCTAIGQAEKMPSPKFVLRQEPFILEVTVLSVEEKNGPHSGLSVWHRVRIDQVDRGDGLEIGGETAVVSRVYNNSPGTTGTSGHFGAWRGPNGLPVKGDRARLFASGTAKTLQPHFTNGWQPIEKQVSFVAADIHGQSEITLPTLVEFLEKPLCIAATQHHAVKDDSNPAAEAKIKLTASDALLRADLIVTSLQSAQLDESARRHLLEPLERGIPLVVFGASTAPFASPTGMVHPSGTDGISKQYFGAAANGRHDPSSTTRVLPPSDEAARHPILLGVTIQQPGICIPSPLGLVEPLTADCTVLLWGEAIESTRSDAAQKQPLLWVREVARDAKAAGQRIACTTLVPDDLADPEVRVLVSQMIAWASSRAQNLADAERAAIRAAPFSPLSPR